MDLETTQTNAVAKLPLLKQGEYEMWRLRIEQYFQIQDYALWDIIENGNSFNPVARTTTNADGTSTSTIPGPVTTEEKAQKKNDVKQEFEEMDLKWQLALLSMRARRYYQRTGKKITINGSDTAGYDKNPRNQESKPRNQDSSKRTMNVEDTSSKAMVAIDGAGFDWSLMEEEEVTSNMTLMAFSDSEVNNDKTCSNTCLKSFEALKTQLDNLRVEFNKSEFNLATYKRGLTSIEEQLVFYKKNEVMFCDQIAVLKRDASFKDSEINALKIEIEKLKNEK
ncbi:hypothetical protein Tco_0550593 [Tanacetum coccineum]